MSACMDGWFVLFWRYLDVFVEGRRLAGGPASGPQIRHADDGNIAASR